MARGKIWVRPKEGIRIGKAIENGKIGTQGSYYLQGPRQPPFLHPKNKHQQERYSGRSRIWEGRCGLCPGCSGGEPHAQAGRPCSPAGAGAWSRRAAGGGMWHLRVPFSLQPPAEPHRAGSSGPARTLQATWAACRRLPVSATLRSQEGDQRPGKGRFLGRAFWGAGRQSGGCQGAAFLVRSSQRPEGEQGCAKLGLLWGPGSA